MMASILALVICTLLALGFPASRGLGILGVGLLIVLFPLLTTALALLAGIAYFIYHHYLKGS